MAASASELGGLLAEELARPVFPAAEAACADILAAHGETVRAVLFYGSCLRDGSDEDKILDFYVLVDSPAKANGSAVLGFFNRVLPPNVYYRETPFEGRTVRTKYALMGFKQFRRAMRSRLNVSFWARFSQPAALAFVRDAADRQEVAEALGDALDTFARVTAPLMTGAFSPRDFWAHGFARTYGAELRSEAGEEKGRELVDLYPERYERLLEPVLASAAIRFEKTGAQVMLNTGGLARLGARLGWVLRSVVGKSLSLLRLIKGAFTFQGGIDYLAWKIRRHSGVEVEVRPWQRRHQIIGGLSLFWTVRKKGGFR